MCKRLLSSVAVFAVVVLMIGCSEAPVTEFDAGKKALETAQQAEAELYAPAVYKEAMDSLNAASVEIQKQDGRFSMLRDYDQAKATITAAQQLAAKAASEAAVEKENMRLLDSTLIVEIDALMVEAKTALAKAPKGKGTRLDIKVMQTDLDAAATALTAATTDYQAGNYLVARDKLQAVKSQITRVKNDIGAAVTKVTP